jgi:hypothetical protein
MPGMTCITFNGQSDSARTPGNLFPDEALAANRTSFLVIVFLVIALPSLNKATDDMAANSPVPGWFSLPRARRQGHPSFRWRQSHRRISGSRSPTTQCHSISKKRSSSWDGHVDESAESHNRILVDNSHRYNKHRLIQIL